MKVAAHRRILAESVAWTAEVRLPAEKTSREALPIRTRRLRPGSVALGVLPRRTPFKSRTARRFHYRPRRPPPPWPRGERPVPRGCPPLFPAPLPPGRLVPWGELFPWPVFRSRGLRAPRAVSRPRMPSPRRGGPERSPRGASSLSRRGSVPRAELPPRLGASRRLRPLPRRASPSLWRSDPRALLFPRLAPRKRVRSAGRGTPPDFVGSASSIPWNSSSSSIKTASSRGTSARGRLMRMMRSMARTVSSSRPVTKVEARPLAPARAVRPIRWT